MLYKFSLATTGVCVFYALTAVGAFFNFGGTIDEKIVSIPICPHLSVLSIYFLKQTVLSWIKFHDSTCFCFLSTLNLYVFVKYEKNIIISYYGKVAHGKLCNRIIKFKGQV